MKKTWFQTNHRYLFACAGKFLKLMKFTIFIIALATMQTFALDNYAQTKKMDVKIERSSIVSALEKIEAQSEFFFFYNNKVVRLDKKVSVDLKDKTINEILDEVFRDTEIEYTINNRQIILSEKETGNPTSQQQKTVTGKVTDPSGSPLPGASIVLKGTTTGVTTDNGGNFILSLPANATVLVFSFVGMKSQEITIGTKTTINVAMVEESTGLEEVVAIGYGTVRKADLTGAVSVVKAAEFKNVVALSVGNAMQGLVPGVNIRSSGGIGSEPDVEIRGLGNFTNNNPLYVIDGLPTTGNRDFNVNDIESIQILKDASAAAIYGSRAANGVIIIETKKGSAGAMKVSYTGKVSVDNLPMMNLMGRDEWIKITTQAYQNAINDGVPDVHTVPTWMNGNTNWNKAVFRTAVIKDHNLSFSGGGKNEKYLVSMNYFDNPGTVYGTSMNRYSLRVNTEGKKGILTIGENLAISNTFVEEQNSVFSKHIDVLRMLPIIPIHDSNNFGGYGYGNEISQIPGLGHFYPK